MTDISKLKLPDNIKYSKDHEWTRIEGDKIKIGINDYAQDQLGDVVFVEMPEIGSCLQAGDEFGSVESVKAVSEIFMPVGGEVVSINTNLENNPELVNKSPYDKGWIIEIKPDDIKEIDKLMDKDKYLKSLA